MFHVIPSCVMRVSEPPNIYSENFRIGDTEFRNGQEEERQVPLFNQFTKNNSGQKFNTLIVSLVFERIKKIQ